MTTFRTESVTPREAKRTKDDNIFQKVTRPLEEKVTKESFLRTMEELFGPNHPISFIDIIQETHQQKVIYMVTFSPGKDPYLSDLHNDINWAIVSHYLVQDGTIPLA